MRGVEGFSKKKKVKTHKRGQQCGECKGEGVGEEEGVGGMTGDD